MRNNQEKTKTDRLRFALGLLLGIVGLLMLIFTGAFGFTDLVLTFASLALIVGGVLIAGSTRLAELFADLLR